LKPETYGVVYWNGENYVNGGSQYLEKGALAHLKSNGGHNYERYNCKKEIR
jgi:hypothetical protein